MQILKRACLAVTVTACTLNANAQDAPRVNPSQSPGALTTVANLDVPRYMGTWFEIAKYPNWFQRTCASNTKAEYGRSPTVRCKW